MNMNDTRIIVSDETLQALKGTQLLVDTSLIIDISHHPAEFEPFFEQLEEVNCALVTIRDVRLEFLSKVKSTEQFKKNRDLIRRIILAYIDVETADMFNNNAFLFEFAKQSSKFSSVDFLLAKALQQPGLRLITSNHSDFTTRLFDVDHVITGVFENSIRSYGVYKLSENKYQAEVREDLRIYRKNHPQ